MRLGTLYLSTVIVFLAVDAVMLSSFITPIFRAEIGDLMAKPIRAVPALGFYLGYVAAVLYLASYAALKIGRADAAIVPAAVLGLAAYGTFEFTSYAILEAWKWHMVLIDTIWGGVLTGFSAWAGVAISLRIFGKPGG